MSDNQKILKRIGNLGNVANLLVRELDAMRRELEPKVPATRSRQNLKAERKTKYNAMIHKSLIK